MIQLRAKDFPQLSYYKTGEGLPIILLHGFPANADLWREITPVLSKYYTVIAPDLPGSGQSTFSGPDLSMELIAQSVSDILEHEGIDSALIAGHSMGGYVAFAFASLFPQKVKGISLVHSTAIADTEEKKENRRKSIEIIRKGGKETFIKQMVPNLFAPGFKDANPDMIAVQVKAGMETDADNIIAMQNAMINRPDRRKMLENAAMPVQWIIGKKDNLLPFDKALQQSYLANVNFVSVYNDTGHMSMLENPDVLCDDIINFATFCYK